MSFIGSIRDTLSSRALPGELQPTGLLDRMAGFGLVTAGSLYILFDAFGGIIRGVFGSVGLTPIIYLPGAIAIVAVIVNLLPRIGDPATAGPTLAVIGFVVTEILLALFLGRAPGAIAFELYACLPALVMMSIAQRRMQDRVIAVLIPTFFIAVIGVYLNSVIKFPWAGASFEVMGKTVTASREWSEGGTDRLAGFSRASVAAAAQILIGYCALEYRLKSLLWRAVWWVVGLIGIHLTTSKSPELAMLLLPLSYFVIGRVRATGGARRLLPANLLMLAWVVLIFLGPIISMTYGAKLFPNGAGMGRDYSSFADRVVNTWPNAMALVDWSNPVSWLVGRGLGGIGGPSAMFEPPGNPGDNVAIYLFVTFGMVALLFAYLIFRGAQRSASSGARGRRDFALIVAFLGIGSASSAIESIVPCMILGLAIARPLQRLRGSEGTEGQTASQGRRRLRRRSSDKPAKV